MGPKMWSTIYQILFWLGLAASVANGMRVTSLKVNLKASPELKLFVSFVLNNQEYEFRDMGLFRSVLEAGQPSTTFRSSGRPSEKYSWASATLLPNDRLIGVFYYDEGKKSIQIDTDESSDDIRSLTSDPDTAGIKCGTITTSELEGNGLGRSLATRVTVDCETRPPPDPLGKDQSRMRANFEWSTARLNSDRNLAVERWFDDGTCFSHGNVTRQFSIGVVVDTSMEQRAAHDGFPSIEKYVETIVASASATYLAQINIELVVKQVFKRSKAITTIETTLTGPQRVDSMCKTLIDNLTRTALETDCCSDSLGMAQRLEILREWASSLPMRADASNPNQMTRQGHWHLLTNCHPSPGFVGRSFIGTLCHATYGVGLSSWGAASDPNLAHWRIFAHEIGHAFNSSHSFEYGVGLTGGLMDYGNGKYQDDYQIHPFKRIEVCSEITSQVDTCLYLNTKSAACGDGIVDKMKGEECECSVLGVQNCPDCLNCRLVQGSQCVRDSGPCCSPSGQFMPSTTSCSVPGDERSGVCIMGTCQPSVCNSAVSGVCGSDGCRVRCAPISKPLSCSASSYSLPDSVPCALPGQSSERMTGSCVAGVCTADMAASVSSCIDRISPWWDSDGIVFTCKWYSSSPSYCDKYGYRNRNFGLVAAEACCACGGGYNAGQKNVTESPAQDISLTNPPTTRPTAQNTRSPTMLPTSASPSLSPTIQCPPTNRIASCSSLRKKSTCQKSRKGCAWCTRKRPGKKSVNVCVPGPCSLARACSFI